MKTKIINGDDNKSKKCASCNATIHNTETYCSCCKKKQEEERR